MRNINIKAAKPAMREGLCGRSMRVKEMMRQPEVGEHGFLLRVVDIFTFYAQNGLHALINNQQVFGELIILFLDVRLCVGSV